MLHAIATVGYLGRLPKIGGMAASMLGLGLACFLFLVTVRTEYVMAGWCFCFALAAWALPRALEDADLPNSEIVIDRFAGIWLAVAPAIPLAAVAKTLGTGPILVALGAPWVLYHLILALPLRRMDRSGRVWVRIGDDLIAGVVTMLVVLAVMALLLMELMSRSGPAQVIGVAA